MHFFLVDKATRYKSIYPLTNLKSDILNQIQQFCANIGFVPRRFACDCDNKLMSKQIQQWLAKNNSIINCSPKGRQNQNGLCERNWRTVIKMARSWIASHELPSSFWWHALKRATEISNYLSKLTTNIQGG